VSEWYEAPHFCPTRPTASLGEIVRRQDQAAREAVDDLIGNDQLTDADRRIMWEAQRNGELSDPWNVQPQTRKETTDARDDDRS